jgi:drug/metabolite transporter (DMT)-like permease
MLPFLNFSPITLDTNVLFRPIVWANLLFLGIIASMLCYILWNTAIKHLGTVRTSNYLYFVPIVTLITSSIVINEIITPTALLGATLILSGVYWGEKK